MIKADTETRFTIGDKPLEGIKAVNHLQTIHKLNGLGMTVCKFCGKVVSLDFHKCSHSIKPNEHQDYWDERLL